MLSGLLLSANLGGLLHLATHAHTYCAEHGQIVHATEPELRGGRPAPAALDPLHAGLSAEPARPERGLEHCVHAQLLGRSHHLQPAALLDQRAIAEATPDPQHPAATHASDELCLLQAPKTSPPRA